ncbi:hypothetical protein PPL_03109 [Heterostelium album PN500]|uniref:Uncharacterized protein n=1 Tax=Heterostelium pallidum (strain ATCC 26659 / Pp 5 / PN500) TaxID=670386 RepID=D3B3Y8_HETP5|nr:hypothetical protein PPL_03109 [Heterostelium album PN500]EFA84036.1 hypothetical protein PPL_03109 [Heterostelium album PN500]|eukprot:XP_020436153.1 hypothetical protein PPL_03109 [Heterostelium album PN500]
MNISLPITTTYTGLLSFRKICSSGSTWRCYVSAKKDGIAFDSRKYSKLLAAIRSHGNFIEYVPLQLMLAGLLEIQGFNSKYLQFILAIFTIGRISHAIGLSKHNHLGPGRPSDEVFRKEHLLLFWHLDSSETCLYCSPQS